MAYRGHELDLLSQLIIQVLVTVIMVLGRYLIVEYLDPLGMQRLLSVPLTHALQSYLVVLFNIE